MWASTTPLTFFKNSCYDYVRWQNKATQFYIAARLLYFQDLISPSVFCAFQAVENLMKATILFYKGIPFAEGFGHALKKMEREINSQIIKRISKKGRLKKLAIPAYFVHENRFQALSRYPRVGKGIGVGGFVIEDLDQLMFDLLKVVPFQFNTLLLNEIRKASHSKYKEILEKDNKCLSELKAYLASGIQEKSADETIYKLHSG
ncbi:MAG: HEPN domain-containing protein [Candidatus Omnitrophota bacterium]